MKKLMLSICLLVGFSQFSNAQLNFGVKAGVNYNSNSFKESSSNLIGGADGKTGYHAGIWLRAKIPAIGLFIKPELVYTNLKSEVTFDARNSNLSLRKIDIPVLLGKKVFGIGNVYVGPAFQYILDSDYSLSDISDVKTDDFSMGIQFGGGIEIGKIGIDIRWERSLSDFESNLVSSVGNANYDTRVNQIIFGLTYKL